MSRMPQVTARELVAFLKAHGFVEDRQTGSHLTLRHEDREVSVTVPDCIAGATSDAAWRLRIIKDAGFTVEDFQ